MAAGDIIQVKDTFEFDTTHCTFPHACHISGNVYAIVYNHLDVTNHGIIKTIEIVNGMITEPPIDTYDFIADSCYHPRIYHIYDTTYCVVFKNAGADAELRTFTIADNGQITEPEIDTGVFSTTANYPSLQHVFGDVYVILYGHGGGLAYAFTWTISGLGALGAADIANNTVVAADLTVSNMISVAHGIYAFSHSTGAGALGHVQTFSVSNDGLTITAIDTLQIDAVALNWSKIFHIHGNVYAVAYSQGVTSGKIVTFTITGAGAIGAAEIDHYVFEAVGFQNLSVALVTSTVYSIAFQGPDGDGWLKTVEIAIDGQITEPFIDDFEFETDEAIDPCLLRTDDGYYAIAYTGPDTDGFLKTLEIAGDVPASGHTELVMGIGP